MHVHYSTWIFAVVVIRGYFNYPLDAGTVMLINFPVLELWNSWRQRQPMGMQGNDVIGNQANGDKRTSTIPSMGESYAAIVVLLSL